MSVRSFSNTLSVVPGYRPRMLAVRSIPGIASAKIFRLHLFWIFTFCGMSLPYRIWFKRHCDSIRVTIVKETSASPSSTSSYWSYASRWIPSRASMEPHRSNYSEFRSYMKGRLLYGTDEEVNKKVPQPQTAAEESDPLSEDMSQKSGRVEAEASGVANKSESMATDAATSSESSPSTP
jgi:hypothetical protein